MLGVYLFTVMRKSAQTLFYSGRTGYASFSFEWNISPWRHWARADYQPTEIGPMTYSYGASYGYFDWADDERSDDGADSYSYGVGA